MMEHTDRHLRRLLRLISPRIRLFTEMVPAGVLLHARDPGRHAPHGPTVALQVGGAAPKELGACARIAEERGFCEINLNVGCPSGRVAAGAFGACLMREPARVADCVAAMRAATRLPVTVKCRLGVDDQDAEESLDAFVQTVAAAGCRTFYMHARKALLHGLSPKQNRSIPPLVHARVWRVKRDFPQLEIIVNGGIRDAAEAARQVARTDGVMLGRVLYEDIWRVHGIDRALFPQARGKGRLGVLEEYLSYVRARLGEGESAARLARPLMSLFHGRPGAKEWRCAVARAGESGVERLWEVAQRIRAADGRAQRPPAVPPALRRPVRPWPQQEAP